MSNRTLKTHYLEQKARIKSYLAFRKFKKQMLKLDKSLNSFKIKYL